MCHKPDQSSCSITINFFQRSINIFLFQIRLRGIYRRVSFIFLSTKRQSRFQSVFFFGFVCLPFSFVVVDHVYYFFLGVYVGNQLGWEVFCVLEKIKENFFDTYLDWSFKTFLIFMDVENLLFRKLEPSRSENISFSTHFGYFLLSIHFFSEPQRSWVKSKRKQIFLLPLFNIEIHFSSFNLRLTSKLVLRNLCWFFLFFS